ncbi:hypothetical protein Taro_008240 [Colocasia esculenta]|uniref:Apple domain-containing protein n=1 Tax=Colocasia esculenta TaxID=4460 RepID=A0A843U0I5_COLES|nr:hypothetical protein [Colocasia esculenta]
MGVPGNGNNPNAHRALGQALKCHSTGRRLNSEGKYSLVLEPRALSLYMQDASPRPLPYGRFAFPSSETAVTFTATPEGNSAWQLGLRPSTGGSLVLAQPKYNATISLLRLQVDGNLVAYTYNDQVDSQPTERTFVFFSDGARGVLAGCELPSKCGSLGVCKDDACVACPTPRGLLGWSERCSAPKPGGCRVGANQGYYKVAGVENFLTKFVEGEGAIKLEECRRRCSMDCTCLGFFYWEESSRCWLAPTLGTLNRVSATAHVAYIKS